jgi:hypothetical protein
VAIQATAARTQLLQDVGLIDRRLGVLFVDDGKKVDRIPSAIELQRLFDSAIVTEDELVSDAEWHWKDGDQAAEKAASDARDSGKKKGQPVDESAGPCSSEHSDLLPSAMLGREMNRRPGSPIRLASAFAACLGPSGFRLFSDIAHFQRTPAMTAKVLCLLPLAMAAALNGQQSRPPREHNIDLLAIASATEQVPKVPLARQLTIDVSISVTTHEPPRAPLASIGADAPIFDRAAYQIGDSFVYEVTFVNSGSAPVTFPTLLQADRVDRDIAGASVAVLALRFEDEALGPQKVGYSVLYGAEPVEGSLLIVEPGERLRVRAQGKWFLGNGVMPSMQEHWQRDVQVRAQLQFMKGRRYLELVSGASTPVRLRQ